MSKKNRMALLSGNRYEVDKMLNFILEKIKTSNIKKYDFKDKDCNVNEICEEIISSDIFSEKKVIILKNLPRDTKKILYYLDRMPDTNVVIFHSESSYGKYKSLVNKIKENGIVKNFEKEIDDPEKFTKKILEEKNIEYDEEVPNLISESCNKNIDFIVNEIEKISNYLDKEQKLSINDLKEIGFSLKEFIIWDLIDKISIKDVNGALAIINDSLNNDEVEVEYILIMLHRYFKLALMCKEVCGLRKENVYTLREILNNLKKPDGRDYYNYYEILNMTNKKDTIYQNYKFYEISYALYYILNSLFECRTSSDKEYSINILIELMFSICHPKKFCNKYKSDLDYIYN